jgi:hypothetical protein
MKQPRHQHEGAAREERRDRYDPERRAAQPARQAKARGYRHDSARHKDARATIPAERRQAIARMGGHAKAKAIRNERRAIDTAERQPPPAPATQRTINPRTSALVRLATGRATPAEIKAATAAARAAASRPARRAAARARKAAEDATKGSK